MYIVFHLSLLHSKENKHHETSSLGAVIHLDVHLPRYRSECKSSISKQISTFKRTNECMGLCNASAVCLSPGFNVLLRGC